MNWLDGLSEEQLALVDLLVDARYQQEARHGSREEHRTTPKETRRLMADLVAKYGSQSEAARAWVKLFGGDFETIRPRINSWATGRSRLSENQLAKARALL